GEPDVEQFRHNVQHVLHALVHAARMQVGANGVGFKPLLYGGHRLLVGKAATAMADVEYDSTLLRFQDEGFKLAIVDGRHSALHMCVTVCEDVARAELVHKQRFQRQRRVAAAKVDHHRYVREATCLDSAFGRHPRVSFEVGELDPNHVFFVFLCHFCGHGRIHVLDILFALTAAHPTSHNVEERQHTGGRLVDRLCLERREVPPSCTTYVDNRCHTRTQREPVGGQRRKTVAEIAIRFGSEKVVAVNID